MSDTLNTKETKLVMRNTEYCTSTIEYNGNSYKMSTEGNLKQIKDKQAEKSIIDEMNKGFAEMNLKFDSITKEIKEEMNARFAEVNSRFVEVDTRFTEVNTRFIEVNVRLDSLENKLNNV
ncbi:MAG: hypothetical protein RR193_07020, partial [Christensenellaceae bacterium]